MLYTEDFYDIVENIGDLTVEDVKRHLTLSESSSAEPEDTFNSKVEGREGVELEKCEVEALEALQKAAKAVTGLVTGETPADEATGAVLEAARAVEGFVKAAEGDPEVACVAQEVQDRVQGLLSLYRTLTSQPHPKPPFRQKKKKKSTAPLFSSSTNSKFYTSIQRRKSKEL